MEKGVVFLKNIRRIRFALKAVIFPLLSILVIIFLFVLFRSNGLSGNESEGKEYQYLHFDVEQKSISTGFIKLNRILENDYISYQDESGNLNLLSKIGHTEYVCTGSCSCNTQDRRSLTISQPFQRGLVYLVGALSSILAIREAKEYFSSVCSEAYDCPLDRIESTIEECKPAKEEENSLKKVEQIHPPKYNENLEDFNYGNHEYHCDGGCLSNHFYEVSVEKKVLLKTLEKTSDNYGCGYLDLFETVNVPYKPDRKYSDIAYARLVFLQKLDAYCTKSSHEDVHYFSDDGSKINTENYPMCIGHWVGENPLVNCNPSNVYNLDDDEEWIEEWE